MMNEEVKRLLRRKSELQQELAKARLGFYASGAALVALIVYVVFKFN